MTTFIIIICAILLLLGLLGCFVPVVPGPPLAYIPLLILTAFTDYKCSDEFSLAVGRNSSFSDYC